MPSWATEFLLVSKARVFNFQASPRLRGCGLGLEPLFIRKRQTLVRSQALQGEQTSSLKTALSVHSSQIKQPAFTNKKGLLSQVVNTWSYMEWH